MREVSVVVSLILLMLGARCNSDRSSARSRNVVSADGRIGKLHIDQSDRAAVIAFVGKPDAERHGRGRAPYDALGYGCGRRSGEKTYPLVPFGPPYCRTAFWIDVPSGKLENFFTSDSRYVEAHGVRIGMPSARAERLLHRHLTAGCGTNIALRGRDYAGLTIAFTGGTMPDKKTSRVTGAHVFAFVLHARHRDAYVFDCM